MKRAAALFLALVLLPQLAIPAGVSSTFVQLVDTGRFKLWRPLRVDVSTSIASTDPRIGGQTIASGDWVNKPMNCQGASEVTLYYWEYGTGSGAVKVWECLQTVGSPGAYPGPFPSGSTSIAALAAVGVEDPASAPTPADPDPFCVEATQGVAVDGVNAGSGGDKVTISSSGFGLYLIEQDDCTGNCDGEVLFACEWEVPA